MQTRNWIEIKVHPGFDRSQRNSESTSASLYPSLSSSFSLSTHLQVLKLEGDMRVEENVTGPPNKIKNELIDFIRGGGNASTATNGDFAISAVLSGMGFVTLELARALRIRAIQT